MMSGSPLFFLERVPAEHVRAERVRAARVRARGSRRSAFTLLEVIVAVSILALIGMLTFSTVATALDARDWLEKDDAANQSARIAMDRLHRDFELAWLTPNIQAVNTFKTIFIAKNNDPDKVWFTALSHRKMHQNARESDQTELTYWTEDDPTKDGALVLLRREAARIYQEPEKDGAILPLAYGVKTFNVRFLDPTTNEWKDEWDTTGVDTPYRLPRAVRIVLEMFAPDPDDPERDVTRTYASTVILAYGPTITRQPVSQ